MPPIWNHLCLGAVNRVSLCDHRSCVLRVGFANLFGVKIGEIWALGTYSPATKGGDKLL
jgi:hypothetical protein